jgi:hypothetical protein
MKYDWKRDGVEHLEREGCIINIRIGLRNLEGKEVTSIEIIPDSGWQLEGSCNNRVIKEVNK